MANVDCPLDGQKFQGVFYCYDQIQNQNGSSMKVHLVAVELQNPAIRLEYLLPEGINRSGELGECKDVNRTEIGNIGCDDPQNSAYYPLLPWDEAPRNFENTVVVVTGDYGATSTGSRTHGPEGLTVVQGERLDGPQANDHDNTAVTRPWLAIGNPPYPDIRIAQLSEDDGAKPYEWIYTAFGGAPWMIRNGKVTEGEITNCNQAAGSCYSSAAQVAVGLSEDNQWMFLVVTESPVPPLDDLPTPLLDLAHFMRNDLQVYQAFKLDGGGSTKLWYGGEDIYVNSDRELSQYLAVVSLPIDGHGEVVTGPVEVTEQPGSQFPLPEFPVWNDFSSSRVDGFGMGSSTHLRVGISEYEKYLQKQQQMGIRWIREEFPWNEIELSQGNFRWEYAFGDTRRDFDRMVALANDYNIEVVGLLGYSPEYLSDASETELLEAWRGYLTAVVDRYGDKIDYWEIENEVNSRFFWGKVVNPISREPADPNPVFYGEMLRIAHEIIKKHDPQDTIVLGGLVTVTDRDCETNPYVYLKGLHDAGVWDKFDVIGFHPYWGPYPPEEPVSRGKQHDIQSGACQDGERVDTLIEEVRRLRYLAEQYGSKPIWITELGWDQPWLQAISSYRGSTPEQIEADYLVRTYVPLLSEPGVEKIFWYTLVNDRQDQNFALNAPGNKALENLANLLNESKPLGQFQGQNDLGQPGDNDVYEYRFEANGKMTIIVWKARGGEAFRDVVLKDLTWDTVSLYSSDDENIFENAGEERTVVDGALTIQLNEHPIILIGHGTSFWDELTGLWDEWSQMPQEKLQEWWEERANEWQKEIEAWIEQQQERLVEWFVEEMEQQLIDWLNQTCGMALLPAFAVSSAWYIRRKSKFRE
jgi:hypothetical protein